MEFTDLSLAKKFAKNNAPNSLNVGGYELKVGVVLLDTPIGKVKACVSANGTSGAGVRRPSVSVLFKDGDGGSHSQSHLQNMINQKTRNA